MISLREYFLENIDDKSYYKKFKDNIEFGYDDAFNSYTIPDLEFPITDTLDDDIIKKFKNLVQPSNHYNEYEEFILICFYLNHRGYYIKQFPTHLETPSSLSTFAYDEIRTFLIENGRDDAGTVRWNTRRALISKLEFSKKDKINTNFSEDIEKRFMNISTRGSKFDNMSNPEKLKEILNMIEHKLKVKKNFIEIKEENTYGLISNKNIMDYRKKLHCYRHSDEINMRKREELKGIELFLIHYGISIIHLIFEEKHLKFK